MADDLVAAADIAATHLALGLGGAVLVCVPVPRDVALDDDVARDAVVRAVAEADAAGVGGPALTPWLLARIADLTAGASVRANTGAHRARRPDGGRARRPARGSHDRLTRALLACGAVGTLAATGVVRTSECRAMVRGLPDRSIDS